eukprot:gene12921-5950_t
MGWEMANSKNLFEQQWKFTSAVRDSSRRVRPLLDRVEQRILYIEQMQQKAVSSTPPRTPKWKSFTPPCAGDGPEPPTPCLGLIDKFAAAAGALSRVGSASHAAGGALINQLTSFPLFDLSDPVVIVEDLSVVLSKDGQQAVSSHWLRVSRGLSPQAPAPTLSPGSSSTAEDSTSACSAWHDDDTENTVHCWVVYFTRSPLSEALALLTDLAGTVPEPHLLITSGGTKIWAPAALALGRHVNPGFPPCLVDSTTPQTRDDCQSTDPSPHASTSPRSPTRCCLRSRSSPASHHSQLANSSGKSTPAMERGQSQWVSSPALEHGQSQWVSFPDWEFRFPRMVPQTLEIRGPEFNDFLQTVVKAVWQKLLDDDLHPVSSTCLGELADRQDLTCVGAKVTAGTGSAVLNLPPSISGSMTGCEMGSGTGTKGEGDLACVGAEVTAGKHSAVLNLPPSTSGSMTGCEVGRGIRTGGEGDLACVGAEVTAGKHNAVLNLPPSISGSMTGCEMGSGMGTGGEDECSTPAPARGEEVGGEGGRGASGERAAICSAISGGGTGGQCSTPAPARSKEVGGGEGGQGGEGGDSGERAAISSAVSGGGTGGVVSGGGTGGVVPGGGTGPVDTPSSTEHHLDSLTHMWAVCPPSMSERFRYRSGAETGSTWLVSLRLRGTLLANRFYSTLLQHLHSSSSSSAGDGMAGAGGEGHGTPHGGFPALRQPRVQATLCQEDGLRTARSVVGVRLECRSSVPEQSEVMQSAAREEKEWEAEGPSQMADESRGSDREQQGALPTGEGRGGGSGGTQQQEISSPGDGRGCISGEKQQLGALPTGEGRGGDSGDGQQRGALPTGEKKSIALGSSELFGARDKTIAKGADEESENCPPTESHAPGPAGRGPPTESQATGPAGQGPPTESQATGPAGQGPPTESQATGPAGRDKKGKKGKKKKNEKKETNALSSAVSNRDMHSTSQEITPSPPTDALSQAPQTESPAGIAYTNFGASSDVLSPSPLAGAVSETHQAQSPASAAGSNVGANNAVLSPLPPADGLSETLRAESPASVADCNVRANNAVLSPSPSADAMRRVCEAESPLPPADALTKAHQAEIPASVADCNVGANNAMLSPSPSADAMRRVCEAESPASVSSTPCGAYGSPDYAGGEEGPGGSCLRGGGGVGEDDDQCWWVIDCVPYSARKEKAVEFCCEQVLGVPLTALLDGQAAGEKGSTETEK